MDPLFAKAQLDVQERLEILPEELVELITNGSLDAVTLIAQKKYGLSEEQIRLLENEIILILALFLPKRDFIDNIKESLVIDDQTAFGISEMVQDSLFSLVDDILAAVETARKEAGIVLGKVDLSKKIERKEDLNKLAQTLSAPNPERLQPTNIETVEPIRTMEGDMNRVHGYGAYRAQQETQEGGASANSSEETPSNEK